MEIVFKDLKPFKKVFEVTEDVEIKPLDRRQKRSIRAKSIFKKGERIMLTYHKIFDDKECYKLSIHQNRQSIDILYDASEGEIYHTDDKIIAIWEKLKPYLHEVRDFDALMDLLTEGQDYYYDDIIKELFKQKKITLKDLEDILKIETYNRGL